MVGVLYSVEQPPHCDLLRLSLRLDDLSFFPEFTLVNRACNFAFSSLFDRFIIPYIYFSKSRMLLCTLEFIPLWIYYSLQFTLVNLGCYFEISRSPLHFTYGWFAVLKCTLVNPGLNYWLLYLNDSLDSLNSVRKTKRTFLKSIEISTSQIITMTSMFTSRL